MRVRFWRKSRHVNDNEIIKLQNSFGFSEMISRGVPRNAHKIAVNSSLGLVALITLNGAVEVYDAFGHKRVPLKKKLGSPCKLFQFIGNSHLILIVCESKISSSLPESYHILDSGGLNECITTDRCSSFPRSTCFSIGTLPDYPLCLLTGTSSGSINVADLEGRPQYLNFSEIICLPDLVQNGCREKLCEFSSIQAAKGLIFCTFGQSFTLVLCSKSRRVLKYVEFTTKLTSIYFNDDLDSMLFASSNVIFSMSLPSLRLSSNGVRLNTGFESVSHYKVVLTERNDYPLVMFAAGVPDYWTRSSGVFTIASKSKINNYLLSSPLLDVQIVFSKDTQRQRANAVLLLCEQELLAIDLLDAEFRSISLNFLQCIDSSSVRCVDSVEVPENSALLHCCESSLCSERLSLFPTSSVAEPTKLKNLIFTGHENGQVFVWDLRDGGQRLLHSFRSTDYLSAQSEFNDEEDPEIYKPLELDFTSMYKEVNFQYEETDENAAPSKLENVLLSPTQLWNSALPKRSVELGMYADSTEDDRLAVDSFFFCPERQMIAVGLHGGIVLAASIMEKNGNSVDGYELEWISSKLTETSEQCAVSSAVKLKAASEWPKHSVFKIHQHPLRLVPQSPIRSLAISASHRIVAVGISTGIIVFNSVDPKIIYSRSFLSAEGTQLAIAWEKPLARFNTMKQSVRKSFRQKSVRLSVHGKPQQQRQIERQVEFRDSSAPTATGIRCIQFYDRDADYSYLVVGTSNGALYLFELNAESCEPKRELHFSHGAPVIGTDFIWINNELRMAVFTEEQIRNISVDTFKAKSVYSYKLTAKNGVRIKQGRILSSTDGSYSFLGIICNDGTIKAMPLKDRNASISHSFTNKEDINGISLAALSSSGELAFVGKGGTILNTCSVDSR